MIGGGYEDFRVIHLVPFLSGSSYSGHGGELVASAVWDGKMSPVGPLQGRDDHFRNIDGAFGRGSTKLVLDIRGVNTGQADFGDLKRTLTKGGPYWLEAGVEDIDDLFDVLTLDPEHALMGSVRTSIGVFQEALEVSDVVIPLLYADGDSVILDHRITGIDDALEAISSIGYRNCILMDLRSLGRGADRGFWEHGHPRGLDVIPAGGLSVSDIPMLRRSGHSTAVLDPVLPIAVDKTYEAEPLTTEHSLINAHPKGWWSGS